MTTPLDAMLSELPVRWSRQGISFGPGASVPEITAFESRFHATCPEDFAAYLSRVGGMSVPGEMDEHLIRFLPLSELHPVAEGAAFLSGYFVFADYSISAHAYAIRLTPPRHDVALIHDPGSRVIAPDFTAFLELYLENPRALFSSPG